MIRDPVVSNETLFVGEDMKLSFCGNDCNHCPRYLATQSGDRDKLHDVAQLWNRIGYREKIVLPEEIACHGCASSDWCRYGIRLCVSQRRISNCGECDVFPCKDILSAMEKTLTFEKRVRESCSSDEYELLHKAFFFKRENLEQARRRWKRTNC
jgi:hypothetical protein